MSIWFRVRVRVSVRFRIRVNVRFRESYQPRQPASQSCRQSRVVIPHFWDAFYTSPISLDHHVHILLSLIHFAFLDTFYYFPIPFGHSVYTGILYSFDIFFGSFILLMYFLVISYPCRASNQ